MCIRDRLKGLRRIRKSWERVKRTVTRIPDQQPAHQTSGCGIKRGTERNRKDHRCKRRQDQPQHEGTDCRRRAGEAGRKIRLQRDRWGNHRTGSTVKRPEVLTIFIRLRCICLLYTSKWSFPSPKVSFWTSPSSTRRFKFRYTVPRLMFGNSSRMLAYTASAVGWSLRLIRLALMDSLWRLYFNVFMAAPFHQ